MSRRCRVSSVKDTEAFVSTSTLKILRDWHVPLDAIEDVSSPVE
jgi:hypothetical protein